MAKNHVMKVISFGILLSNLFTAVTSQCSNREIGEQSPKGKSGSSDNLSGVGYILRGDDVRYNVDCCGTITEWVLFTSQAGTVYLQVWRPTTGNDYVLVGENVIAVAAGENPSLPIAAGDQISVRPGDRIGWFADGNNIIEHKAAGTIPETTIQSMTRPTVGSTTTWPTTSVQTNTYAIKAIANGGSGPTIDSPADNTAYSILNNEAIGTAITTVTWSDPDVGDELNITMTTNSKFTFTEGTGTGTLSVATSLSGNDSTETLTFTVTDFCGNTDDITITVDIVNEPPVLHDMPAAVTLSEDTTTQTLLYTINATDTADPITCSFSPATTDPFSINQVSGTSDYGIYVDDTPNLSYNTKNSYTFTVKCNDGYKDSNTGTFYVYLVKNKTPVIHNLQAATSISTSAGIGTNVFTVNATDDEGDAITYSMSCNPTPCPFTIFASGEIQLNADISSYATVGYDIEITVADAKNTADPKILTVIIKDINDPVLINNLPLANSYTVQENTPLASSVFDVSISDQDTQTWTYSMASTPGTGSSYFSINSGNGRISTSGTLLDYEALVTAGTTSFTFVITVNDGTASDTESLVIDVINVNEAPKFALSTYSLSTTEGSAGDVIGTPTYGVTDEDSGDTKTFSLNCGDDTASFYMDSSTGQVSFQSDYSIATTTTVTVTCTVTIVDAGGLTDTATLYIYISDRNENTPVFSPASYSFYVSYYASVGTVVGSVTASDNDNGTFGTLTYSLDQASLLDEYFSIDNNGQITVLKSPTPLNFLTTVSVSATATDGGALSDTAPVSITISDTTTTSTTTTTDRYKTFMDDGRNIPWLVACIVLTAIFIGLLIWIIGTCSGDKGCRAFQRQFFGKKKQMYRPKIRRLPTPQTPRSPPKPQLKLPSYLVSVRNPPPPKGEQAWRSTVNQYV
ncbi:protocadherin-like protein [Ruditapes philippinarum]|uniref:protocadherin-like protein n=1 Tax=Ruditapes philippinarum TaxID=129788 RepID=UPI00295B9546|nr:protocadherin-like protein [Ruditapes philippinarum]